MAHWDLTDIPWQRFEPERVDPDMLAVVKAAALVEHNAADYAAYLRNVFADDAAFRAETGLWSAEEIRHGQALGRWAELADPGFDFALCSRRFSEGYRIPVAATASVRGSPAAELVARCVVESGTSSFYSAMRDAACEPVLRAICHRIAGDEYRHYKMFLDALRRHRRREGSSRLRGALVAVRRYREIDDDELAFAFHCANLGAVPYDRRRAFDAYFGRAFRYYREPHLKRAVGMIARAAGFDPAGPLARAAGWLVWRYTRRSVARLAVAAGPA